MASRAAELKTERAQTLAVDESLKSKAEHYYSTIEMRRCSPSCPAVRPAGQWLPRAAAADYPDARSKRGALKFQTEMAARQAEHNSHMLGLDHSAATGHSDDDGERWLGLSEMA